jgi:methylenetetrahydrofolate dehydrogenase (NADP+)/methenyltetrahydrofolate cyclohydrolase
MIVMVIDGRHISANILHKLKKEVAGLPFKPVFCDVLVGDNPVSASYVKIKEKRAESIGLSFRLEQVPENTSESALVEKILELNKTKNMCGLIVQLPLPSHMDRQVILDAIDSRLDVDCLGSVNAEKFYAGHPGLVPPTAGAVMALVDELPESVKSGNFVVVGQGQLVGKPVAYLLRQRGIRCVVTDRTTVDLANVTRTADVLICATGQGGLITENFVKPGCAIIDAGTAEMDGGIVGDVDFESVKNIAGFITPVPGGVGPVTVSMLLYNVVEVAREGSRE